MAGVVEWKLQKCGNCRFNPLKRECHFNPPVLVRLNNGKWGSQRPPVLTTDRGCSNWKPIPATGEP